MPSTALLTGPIAPRHLGFVKRCARPAVIVVLRDYILRCAVGENRRGRGTDDRVHILHDMDFIAKIARKVTVLHEGSVLAEGPMDVVQADPRVIEVYLGR